MGRKNLSVTSGIVQPNTGTSCLWFLIRMTGLSDAATEQIVIIQKFTLHRTSFNDAGNNSYENDHFRIKWVIHYCTQELI